MRVKGIVAIAKEADRWEERFFLGDDPDAKVVYGQPDEHAERDRQEIMDVIRRMGMRRAAKLSGLVSGIMNGKRRLSEKSMRRLRGAIVSP